MISHQLFIIQEATNKIVQGVRALLASTITTIGNKLQSRLECNDHLSNSDVQSICDESLANDGFSELETEYKQTKYFKENFNLSVSSYNDNL